MTLADHEGLTVNPVDFLGVDCRLFIDTNIFMDTDARREGGLKRLFERCSAVSRANQNPIIVPTKVVNELERHSRFNPNGRTERQIDAIAKAKNAIVFLQSAEKVKLVRIDLGDVSNPYADDLFVQVFQTFAPQYHLCLLTNDITLRLRIRLLPKSPGKRLVAGTLSKDGLVQIDDERVLYTRGMAKLRRKQEDSDSREVAELEPLLERFQRVLKVAVPFEQASQVRTGDRTLRPSQVPTLGDKVYATSPAFDGPLTLQVRRGSGAEGTVYVAEDGWMVKVFDPQHITQHRREKIELLASHALSRPGICFPQTSVTNSRGEFVGYVMAAAKGEVLQRTIFNPRRFRATFPDWTKSDLVDVCISFLEKVKYLHSLNIIIGDISPKNLMVDANRKVWIIDSDSWQVEGYPCPVGTPMFTAPAMVGSTYSGYLRTLEDELFAVATMLFMILITGQFPYSRAGSDGDIVALIREGNFTFQYKENSNRDQPEGNWKYMWSHLHPDVKGMFWQTFHRDGRLYHTRPSADDWLTTFRAYKRYLGSADNFDPMSNDVYPYRYKAFRPDTPIYDCRNCHRSIVGIWQESTKSYSRPVYCPACQQRKLCIVCGTTHLARELVDGRCAGCKPGVCVSCAKTMLTSEAKGSTCRSCQDLANSVDASRLCTRCRVPFITVGDVEWYSSRGLEVPLSHSPSDRRCLAALSPNVAKSGSAASPTGVNAPAPSRVTSAGGGTGQASNSPTPRSAARAGRTAAAGAESAREQNAWSRFSKWLQR